MTNSLILSCIILLSVTISGLSQSNMKTQIFFGREVFILTKKEKDSLLKAGTPSSIKNSDGSVAYFFQDGKVLYDIIDIKTLLFSNKNEYDFFNEKTAQIASENVQSRLPIKDESFIEKRDMYIALMAEAFKLKFDFNEPSSLKKFNDFLNTLDEKTLIKYRLSIIATTGEFLLANCRAAEWKYLNIDKDRKIPIVFVDGTFVDVAKIFEIQYFDNFKNGKPMEVSTAIQPYIEYYKK